MTTEVTVQHRPDDLAELVPEWTDLHESSGTRMPFSAPEWALTWLQHFGDDEHNRPVVFVIRESGKLIGVAPYYRHRMPGGLARLQQAGTGVEWIGPFEVPAMLAAPNRGRDVARAVVDRMCELDPSWDWANVSLGDAAHWLEPEWLPDPSFTSLVKRTTAAVVVDLQVPRPEDVLTGHRNLKESLRRARNRLNAEFGPEGWTVCTTSTPQEVGPAFQRLIRLHEERSRAEGRRESHRNVFASPRATSFVAEVVNLLALRDRVRVYELVAGDVVLAAQLVLRTKTATYSSVSGLSDVGWRFSVVTHLQWNALVDAHGAGHAEMNLSIGPNQAKLRWSKLVRYHPEFVIVGPRPVSRAAYSGAQVASSLRSYSEAAATKRPGTARLGHLKNVRKLRFANLAKRMGQ